jgi:hypothetical protein
MSLDIGQRRWSWYEERLARNCKRGIPAKAGFFWVNQDMGQRLIMRYNSPSEAGPLRLILGLAVLNSRRGALRRDWRSSCVENS